MTNWHTHPISLPKSLKRPSSTEIRAILYMQSDFMIYMLHTRMHLRARIRKHQRGAHVTLRYGTYAVLPVRMWLRVFAPAYGRE